MQNLTQQTYGEPLQPSDETRALQALDTSQQLGALAQIRSRPKVSQIQPPQKLKKSYQQQKNQCVKQKEAQPYWSIAPRRFVLAGSLFILGTAYGALHLHWVLPALTSIFLIGIIPLFGIRAGSTVLLSAIMTVGFANASLRQPPQNALHRGAYVKATQSHRVSSDSAADWSTASRKRIGQFFRERLGRKNGSLLSSMVLGSRAVRVDRETKTAFRKSGLSHVLAASGFNLSILVASTYMICRAFCLGARLRFLLSISVMILFLLLAGPSPSVSRAFLMGCILSLGDSAARRAHLPATVVSSAALMLALNPFDITDIGLQLSYLSTAGLILCAPSLLDFTKKTTSQPLRFLGGVLTATLVAQAFVFPLQLFYFQQFNPYFLVANVLAAPFLPTISIAGFACTGVFLIESLCSSTGISSGMTALCFFPIEAFRSLVLFIASFPLAQIETKQPPLPVVLAYYLSLSLWAQFWMSGFRFYFAAAFTACLVLLASNLVK